MAYIITGANRGLGKAIVIGLADKGYDIIACVRNKSIHEQEFEDIAQRYGVSIDVFECELSDKLSLDALWGEINKKEIEIDGLINCAGILYLKPVLFTEYEDIEKVFCINYYAPFLMSKYTSEHLVRKGKGSIINISSIGSLGSQVGGAAYDASKAALNQLTKTMAQELAPFNIRVNAIACGPINTEMFASMGDKERNKLTKCVAFKRAAEPEEIVKMVLFLLSNDSSYITGQIIRVDGGAIV